MRPEPDAAGRAPAPRPAAGPADLRPVAPRAAIWLLLGVAALLWFGTLGYRHLIHPDEGRYAELARHMLVSGDWVTPRLNGILYFEKPALQYWATAAAFAAFGVGEAAARVWPALCGAFVVVALWFAARRSIGEHAATWSAGVLGSCAWWILNGHFVNLDTGLACFMTLSMLGFWVAQRDDATPREHVAGMLVAWAGMALAVLSKGLVGIVLPGAVLVAYSVLARDPAVWRRMLWGRGLALFLAIGVPWFVAVSLRNAEFARFFFIHEHFERFLTTQHQRTGAWWYFVPVLAAGLVPWTTALPGALALGWRRRPGRFQANRLFLAWAAVIFAFFSLSSSKLPSYILPVFPALALLIGQHLATLPARRLALHAMAPLAIAVLLAAVLVAAPRLIDRAGGLSPADLAYRDWLLAGCAVLGAASAIAARFAFRQWRRPAMLALAFGSLVACQLVLLGHQSYAPLKSARTMVETIRPQLAPGAPFWSIRTHDQTLPFYLGRPVTLVDWRDEFTTGLQIEPRLGVPSLEDFAAQWRAAPAGSAAMMRNETLADLAPAGLTMRIAYRDAQRLVIVKP